MRVLLSSIGSRGDVQPILALAIELRTLGHDPVLLVSPNFRSWVESFGIGCLAIGPDVRQRARQFAQAAALKKPTKEQLRQLARHTVREQFQATIEAARDCDLMVVGGVLQTAGRSVAEALRIPYVYTAYCPATLRSNDHPPPKMRARIRSQTLPAWVNRLLWLLDERSWNHFFRDVLNEQRAALSLAPVSNVARYVSTQRPWLACDPILAPAATAGSLQTAQTGAWLLSDRTPLPEELEKFLAAGTPPVYFGFGSMQATRHTGRTLVETARRLGHRAIISLGWGDLSPVDTGADCIGIGDVNHQELFWRVAAVVHHGGAGTTTAAARAGKPQVVVPHHYDQYYWAHRVRKLGVGVPGPKAANLTVSSLVEALRESMTPAMTSAAQTLAFRVELHGARIAAERLAVQFG